MKRAILALFLMVAATFAEGPVTPPGIQVLGTPDENNVLVYTNGYLADSGVAPTNLVAVSNQLTEAEGDARYLKLVDADNGAYSDTNAVIAATLAAGRSVPEKLQAMIGAQGARVAWLGDSVSAGFYNGGTSPFAERRTLDQFGYPNLLHYALIASDPRFVPVSPDAFAMTDVAGVPMWSMEDWDTAKFDVENIDSQGNVLSIYVYGKTTGAPSRTPANFDLILYDTAGVAIQTNNVDTHMPGEILGTNSIDNVYGRIVRREVALAQTNDSYTVELINVSADEQAEIFGFTFGKGVDFKNLAVSSTELTEDGPGNVTRKVWPAERLASATNMQANVLFVAWGVNDSKTGVTTPAAFKSDYNDFIADIRSYDSNAVICLVTGPEGLAPPYDNSSEYNGYIKEVATENGLRFFDIESVLNATDKTLTYHDDVHPSRNGHRAITKSLCDFVGVDYVPDRDLKPAPLKSVATSVNSNDRLVTTETVGYWNNGKWSDASIQTFIHPSRINKGSEWVALDDSYLNTNGWWDSLVFALSAAMPIEDEGLTTATWLDWSVTENDGFQTTVGNQPSRVYTNGRWQLGFDGVDDYLEFANTGAGAGNFHYRWEGVINSTSSDIVFSDGNAGGGGKRISLQAATSTDIRAYYDDDAGEGLDETLLSIGSYAGDHLIIDIIRTGTSNIFFQAINLTDSTTNNATDTYAGDTSSVQPLLIGRWNNGSNCSNVLYRFEVSQ